MGIRRRVSTVLIPVWALVVGIRRWWAWVSVVVLIPVWALAVWIRRMSARARTESVARVRLPAVLVSVVVSRPRSVLASVVLSCPRVERASVVVCRLRAVPANVVVTHRTQSAVVSPPTAELLARLRLRKPQLGTAEAIFAPADRMEPGVRKAVVRDPVPTTRELV
ncbi:hypothetical protein [Nocardia amikacinitolerans]|uniref:hypothetical protein n=1 Tax=Nocardia amikacinitolerans TaxID=756689 RepID=UPI0020A2AB87|nr:hypothetical protein [Nocardia amikacinitolerans]